MIMREKQWWNDYNNIVKLAKYLRSIGESIEEILYMLDKPWKYDAEFNDMERMKNVTRE